MGKIDGNKYIYYRPEIITNLKLNFDMNYLFIWAPALEVH